MRFESLRSNLILICSCVLFVNNSKANECKVWSGNDESIKGFIIDKIIIKNQNIFDTKLKGEKTGFHKVANKLHIKTRKNIVARDLIIHEGDRIEDIGLLEEAERILRSRHYIKDAEVNIVELCDGNKLKIKVTTHDNWTLQLGISYGSAGGKSKYSFELQEKNFLGYGKNLEFKYKKGYDRTEKSIRYEDPSLAGSRIQLAVKYQNNSDGKLKSVSIDKPFFSLDTPYSWRVKYLDWSLIHPLYNLGEIEDALGENRLDYQISAGKLIKHDDNNYHRFLYGYQLNKSDFFYSPDYPDSSIPESRNYKYPWLGYQYFEEKYIKMSNFNTMGRVEDVSLGKHFKAILGQDFNNNSSHIDIQYNQGFAINQNNDIVLFNAYFNGIYDSGESLNTHLGGEIKYIHYQSPFRAFFSSLQADMGSNLFKEQRQYLGGETGLRGYPFRYLYGENKLLATVEQRYFHKWYPLKTFKFATALFLDYGSVWNDNEQKTFHADIGVGFRLVPTRTSSGEVIHFDISTPLDSGSNLDNFQFQITSKTSF